SSRPTPFSTRCLAGAHLSRASGCVLCWSLPDAAESGVAASDDVRLCRRLQVVTMVSVGPKPERPLHGDLCSLRRGLEASWIAPHPSAEHRRRLARFPTRGDDRDMRISVLLGIV